MNIPQLPTDNLYKFLALAGVLVLLVGFVAPEIADYELAQREVEIERSRQVIIASGQRILDRINERKSARNERFKQIEELNESIRKIGCVAPGGLDLCKQGTSLRAEYFEDVKAIDEGFDQIVKWKAETAQADSAERVLNYLREKNARFRTISEIAMWCGLVFSFGGFGLWYWLVQRFQDRELRRKATPTTAPNEARKG